MNRRIQYMALVCALTTLASGAEFLVTNQTFNFTESEHGFHYFDAAAGAPGNWLSPDDYYRGFWHVRYEVINYPSTRGINLQTCIWAEVADGWSSWKETCSPRELCGGAKVLSVVSTPQDDWFKMDDVPVNFARPDLFERLGMVLWNDQLCLVSDWAEGCWEQRGDYLPMQMRLSVVAVSRGSSFSGWHNYVTVNPQTAPAAIVQQPASATAAVGQSVQFSVQASGAGALTYSWEVIRPDNSVSRIGGATSATFTVPSVLLSHDGMRFRCTAANAYGSAMSEPAVLTVGATSVAPRSFHAGRTERSQLPAQGELLYRIDGRRLDHGLGRTGVAVVRAVNRTGLRVTD